MNAQNKLLTLSETDTSIEIFIVGGYVRDRLLGRECKDHDFVVTGASVEQMLECGFSQVGADFPVFLAENGDEFALARTERKTGEGYSGFDTNTDDVSLTDDLRRRDLTMNAMARRVVWFNEFGHAKLDDEIIDPFGGEAHLKLGIMVHCSDAFAEDPLRVLRVARFGARYRFGVGADTFEMMKSIVDRGEMQSLTSERVWQETAKAMAENAPEVFWLLLSQVGATDELFPQCPADKLVTNATLSKKVLKSEYKLQFAILTHDLDLAEIDQLMTRMKAPLEIRRVCLCVAALFKDSNHIEALTPERVMRMLTFVDAFRRPDEFFKVLAPALSVVDRTMWIRQMEMCLEAARTITFASLTEHEQKTLQGGAIKDRLTELQLKRIADKLKMLTASVGG